MFNSVHARVAFCIGTVFLIAAVSGSALASGQNPAVQTKSPAQPKVTRHDSVEVVARMSPEEAEEGKLNDLYQSIAELQRQGICTNEVIQRYQSEVIAVAEKSSFNVPKNKFLFLANRDLGNCYMAQQRFAEVEASFKKILEYVAVWPGLNDSGYPINFRQIGEAQMAQQHWVEAEQSLVESIALFDPQIAARENEDAKLHLQLSLNYRGS